MDAHRNHHVTHPIVGIYSGIVSGRKLSHRKYLCIKHIIMETNEKIVKSWGNFFSLFQYLNNNCVHLHHHTTPPAQIFPSMISNASKCFNDYVLLRRLIAICLVLVITSFNIVEMVSTFIVHMHMFIEKKKKKFSRLHNYFINIRLFKQKLIIL